MTFSNGIHPKQTKNIIILPYANNNPPTRGVYENTPSVQYTSNVISSSSNTYYMKTSMIGRIMNQSECIMCPKH